MEGFESFIGVDLWTALFTLLNTIAVFLVMKKFLFKPVKKMIDDRQAEIDGLYADAASSKQEAEAMKAEYQNQLAGANAQRDAILRDAAAKAQRREEDVLAAANREADAIREKARADIVREKKQALNDVKDDISGMAVAIAEKVVEKELHPQDQEKLISSFIDRLGDPS